MQDFQKEFIRFIFDRGALKFGEFTTKSGRKSPYFFNAGGLYKGSDLLKLGEYYAKAIEYSYEKTPDIIYGPAYKGVPLSVVASSQLMALLGEDSHYCFNRKEAKDHGEKGTFVGRVPQKGDRLIIVDDVITAGTSIRETLDLLENIEGLKIVGVLVAVDRQEKGMNSDLSALQEINKDFGLTVNAIINLEHIFEMLKSGELPEVDKDIQDKISLYREKYGT